MTPQEAIETIKIAQAEVEWNYPMDYAAAFDEANRALEKQIAKKPVYKSPFGDDDDDDCKIPFCPNCNKTITDYLKIDWCNNCGQRIDWSEEKEE